jgi:hypothetical protein
MSRHRLRKIGGCTARTGTETAGKDQDSHRCE